MASAQDDLALFVEYDRTRRMDKNYDKFCRYEALLAGWWTHALPAETQRPAVVFICQDDEHRERFLAAADWQLTAHQTRWAELNPEREYAVRDRFVVLLSGRLTAPHGIEKPRQLPRTRCADPSAEREMSPPHPQQAHRVTDPPGAT